MAAHGHITHLLAWHQQRYFRLYKVVPYIHHVSTYSTNRIPHQPQSPSQPLVEDRCWLHGLGWQEISTDHELLFQVSLPVSHVFYQHNTVFPLKEHPQSLHRLNHLTQKNGTTSQTYMVSNVSSHDISYPKYSAFIERYVCTIRCVLSMPKASRIPMPQALMKL